MKEEISLLSICIFDITPVKKTETKCGKTRKYVSVGCAEAKPESKKQLGRCPQQGNIFTTPKAFPKKAINRTFMRNNQLAWLLAYNHM